MYKKIFIENQETTYRIYDDGRLMNEKTGSYYKGTIRNGYRWFDLRWNNKKYARSQHRLIAEAFIPNPNNLPYVHHIDNNRLNNTINNLQWITESDNNLKQNKLPNLKDHKDYLDYDLSQEEWRTFRNTKYMVSNLGRVKNAERDKIIQGKITNSGYREYCLTFDGKKRSFRGHKLTWEVWGDCEPDTINHINGNKLDNRITNLESIINQENTLKAIYDTQVLKFKKTACYDKEGNLVQVFLNNADAARMMNVRPQSISSAIQKGYCSCGYYWKHIEE